MLPEPLQQLLSVPGRTPLDDDEKGVRIVDTLGGEGVQAAGRFCLRKSLRLTALQGVCPGREQPQ